MRRTCARVRKGAPHTAWSLIDTNRSPSRLLRRSSPRTEGNDGAGRAWPRAPGARTISVTGLPPVLAHRAHSEGDRWTRAVGGRPTTLENVPRYPLLFRLQRVDDGRSRGKPSQPLVDEVIYRRQRW